MFGSGEAQSHLLVARKQRDVMMVALADALKAKVRGWNEIQLYRDLGYGRGWESAKKDDNGHLFEPRCREQLSLMLWIPLIYDQVVTVLSIAFAFVVAFIQWMRGTAREGLH